MYIFEIVAKHFGNTRPREMWCITVRNKRALCCDHRLCALEPRLWYLKLPTYCTRQTEPFMVWNEQSSSVCLFCFAKRVRENKKEIRCGSKSHRRLKTHTTVTTTTTASTTTHRTQSAKKRFFLISNFFFFLLFHCNNTGWKYQCRE